jgi:hypothetical protein
VYKPKPFPVDVDVSFTSTHQPMNPFRKENFEALLEQKN